MTTSFLLLVVATGPLLLSWPETTQFCNGAPYDSSTLNAGREIFVREYDAAKTSCWLDLVEEHKQRASTPCDKDDEIRAAEYETWRQTVWACWTESSKNITSLEDFSTDEYADLGTGTLTHTFQMEVGKYYMAMVRELTYKNTFNWVTGDVTNINESFVTLGSWSNIVGKKILLGETQHPLMQFENIIFSEAP